jgi:hypothetical protein
MGLQAHEFPANREKNRELTIAGMTEEEHTPHSAAPVAAMPGEAAAAERSEDLSSSGCERSEMCRAHCKPVASIL